MKQLFANNAKGRLNAGIGVSDTALTLQAGQGALFPSPVNGEFFKCTLVNSSGEIEVIKVTQRTTDTFDVIERDQEGTGAIECDTGDKCELRATKGTLEGMVQRGTVQTINSNTALDESDVNDQLVVTATATITLPPSADIDVGDYVDFKSSTTGNVQIAPDGADTIDGANANYRLPAYSSVRAMKSAAGTYVLLGKPELEVGDLKAHMRATQNLPTGFLWANGEAYAAATYAALFAEYVKTATVTFDVATPGNVNWTGHPLRDDDPVKFTSDGALPAAIVSGTIYYARNVSTDDFEIAATPGGSSIAFAGAGAGTHTGIYAPHGCANDLTTFNTPDMCGRALIGRDDMGDITAKDRVTYASKSGVSGITMGAAGGVEEHAITTSEMPAHTHTIDATTTDNFGGSSYPVKADTDADSSITTNSRGSSAAHTNLGPSIVGLWLVKA